MYGTYTMLKLFCVDGFTISLCAPVLRRILNSYVAIRIHNGECAPHVHITVYL